MSRDCEFKRFNNDRDKLLRAKPIKFLDRDGDFQEISSDLVKKASQEEDQAESNSEEEGKIE